MRWPGTRYDSRIERALHRQHRYFWVEIVAENLTGVEMMGLRSKFNALPFLWAEAGGQREYSAQLAFPVDYFTEAMQRIEDSLRPVSNRCEMYFVDQTSALAFTISYKLYDPESKKWSLDLPALRSKFDELILKIRERGS